MYKKLHETFKLLEKRLSWKKRAVIKLLKLFKAFTNCLSKVIVF